MQNNLRLHAALPCGRALAVAFLALAMFAPQASRASFASPAAAQNPDAHSRPPQTRAEPLVETLHGVKVADPYRWLEQGEAREVRDWTDAQNAHTRRALDSFAGRDAINRRLSQLLSIGTLSAPDPHRGRYFYTRREGQQNQPVLYVREGAAGADRVLLDPNALSPDGTIALDWWYESHDGKRLAYGLSESGSEQSTLYVLDVDTGRNLKDKIPYTRAASLAWLPGGDGFYYTRFPAPGSVPKGEENYHRRVFLHRLGDDPAKDAEVFRREEKPTEWPGVGLSRDGRWLTISVSRGPGKNDLYLRDLRDEAGELVALAEGKDANYSARVVNNRLYILTTEGAANGQIFQTAAANPKRAAWRPFVPEAQDVRINSFTVLGQQILVQGLSRAASRIRAYTREGEFLRDVKLPVLGTASASNGEEDGGEAFFSFASYALPPTVYRYDARTGALDEWARVAAPTVDAKAIEVKQVFYPSKDGTNISMFVVHRKGLKYDGRNPALLYGYGGFNVSQTPGFNRGLNLWLERGGVYAVANLRGGGEYGEGWHKRGMLGLKQNVFDDFIAAAEYLVERKIASGNRLAIQGGSNGGLLVAAAITQRPELFRAVVCAVPLTDMLRYQRFLIARLWIPEYGTAEDPRHFAYLRAYSPYHRVVAGTKYPATLITTAESDSRVDPLHARKFAAVLQAANASAHPILLRVETKAGHGAGKPLTKQIAEATDVWSFLFWQLGVSA
ncbi:MAG TPA: prolyl oligopeptidase family serine peptidase [Pyrinomonadaceae bacterium]|nr:prolyl oligopeptidase family serine peptidase [Pyrinomonadaceae bacterium]